MTYFWPNWPCGYGISVGMVLETIWSWAWAWMNEDECWRETDVQKAIFCPLVRITVGRRGSRLFPPAMAAMAVGLTMAEAGHSHAKLASSYGLLVQILEARCRHSRARLDAAKRTEVARQDTITALLSLSLPFPCNLLFTTFLFLASTTPILSCFLRLSSVTRLLHSSFFGSPAPIHRLVGTATGVSRGEWVELSILCVMLVLKGTDVAWA